MAERRHKQETQKAPKTYNIKMPVYTTSMMEQEEGLFGRVTYQDMISLLKDRLKQITALALHEQGTTKGAAAEASPLCRQLMMRLPMFT